jgi:hypothetical protein
LEKYKELPYLCPSTLKTNKMSKLNPNTKPAPKVDKSKRLAGGYGAFAAKQGSYELLERAVLACLLWEDLAYETGKENDDNIKKLIAEVDPVQVANLAVEARIAQKLRHVPLFMVSEMAKLPSHRHLVAETLEKVITRADQITDFVAIYWKDGKKMLTSQIKKGLAAAFGKFNEYQFAKYDREGAIKLRDVLFLVHAKPAQGKEELYKKIAERTLATPDTWEVALSTGKDKKESWTRLIEENKLGALAFLRNLRNMKDALVDASTVRKGFRQVKSQMLLPLNFFAAAENAPEFMTDINELMLRTYKDLPKLPGKSIFVVDVSGSMGNGISGKSTHTRMKVAAAMAVLANELCEEVEIWCTAGSDGSRVHQTKRIDYPERGFGLVKQINTMAQKLGGGGIFTRQCLEHLKANTGYTPDRIIIFSDSQDCDTYDRRLPEPFGKNNYIVDVSAHRNGVNYKGKWTAEISGWSEHFLTFVSALEGVQNTFEED